MSWTHLDDTLVKKSRKVRQCILCYEQISIGEPYVRRTGVYDGEIDISPMHPECVAVTASWDEMTWECFEPGSMKRGVDEER